MIKDYYIVKNIPKYVTDFRAPSRPVKLNFDLTSEIGHMLR